LAAVGYPFYPSRNKNQRYSNKLGFKKRIKTIEMVEYPLAYFQLWMK
jgi:hypothetical protein